MTVYYLDSSAWVKQFFKEPGSGWIQQLFSDNKHLLASATLGYIEVAAAIVRQQDVRELSPDAVNQAIAALDTNWQGFVQVDLTREVVALAFTFARERRLRGADAMHLAAAAHLKRQLGNTDTPVMLVASDEDLLQAGQAIGFRTINPVMEESRQSN